MAPTSRPLRLKSEDRDRALGFGIARPALMRCL